MAFFIQSGGPDLPEAVLDSVEDGEGECDLEADSVEAGQTALVEASEPLAPRQLADTLEAGGVAPALHPGLDHVYGGVAQHTGAAWTQVEIKFGVCSCESRV